MEQTKSKNVWSALIVGLKLLLICGIIAALVSVIYAVTADQYEKNQNQQKAQAIGVIFGFEEEETPVTKVLSNQDGLVVYEIYSTDGKRLVGYCVEVVESSGYNGDVTMMVGYDAERKLCGIEIVSHSETPGLGSKIEGESFRKQFLGVTEVLNYDTDVDGVSGATYSSKAVTAGVNRATAALTTAVMGGADRE